MSNHVRKDKEGGRKGWAMAFVVVSLFCIIFFAARGRFQAPVSSQAFCRPGALSGSREQSGRFLGAVTLSAGDGLGGQ